MKKLLLFPAVCFILFTQAQDTIFVYELQSGQVTQQMLNPYDTTKTADSTNALWGLYGKSDMPDSLPTVTIPGYMVSYPRKASEYYSTFNFPYTAVVKIKYSFTITAAVIGPRALLVYNFDVWYNNWRNLTDLKPMFEHGAIQYGQMPLTPVRYYALGPLHFMTNYAVIEVEENIGELSGYFGLQFGPDAAQTDTMARMTYNISYPADTNTLLSYVYGTGDTLYMRYGLARGFGFDFGDGRDGDYVAPYFNKDFRIRGNRWSAFSDTKIGAKQFYFLKQVLDNMPTGIEEQMDDAVANIFPNPTNGFAVLQLDEQPKTPYRFSLFNALGQLVLEQKIQEQRTTLTTQHIPPGMYLWRLESGGKAFGKGRLVVE